MRHLFWPNICTQSLFSHPLLVRTSQGRMQALDDTHELCATVNHELDYHEVEARSLRVGLLDHSLHGSSKRRILLLRIAPFHATSFTKFIESRSSAVKPAAVTASTVHFRASCGSLVNLPVLKREPEHRYPRVWLESVCHQSAFLSTARGPGDVRGCPAGRLRTRAQGGREREREIELTCLSH